MAVLTRFSNFDLHQVGLNASDRFADELDIKTANPIFQRKSGGATTATKTLTDAARDFTADAIVTTDRVKIFSGGGNLIRDDSITAVGTTTITVGGADFDTTDSIIYRIYRPPTDAQIRDNTSLRGTGSTGYQEFLQKLQDLVDANTTSAQDLAGNTLDISYHENLTQQVIVFDDGL